MTTINKEKVPRKKPAYTIYHQIMRSHQQLNEPTKTFITRKQALFAQLTAPAIDIESQLDMVYGILHEKIREKIPRDTILSFEGLVEAATYVEESMNPARAKRVRCNFCRAVGHKADECRKKAEVRAISALIKKEEENSQMVRKSPTVFIEIDNIKELGFVDTGTAGCVASYKLYKRLEALGYKFKERREVITLAFGEPRERDILRVNCVVNMCGRSFPTEFLIFPEPEACKTVTLLGIDFIEKAGMVLDMGQLTWWFIDNPEKIYDLINEVEEVNDNENDFNGGLGNALTCSVLKK